MAAPAAPYQLQSNTLQFIVNLKCVLQPIVLFGTFRYQMTDEQLNHTMNSASSPIKTVIALQLLTLVKCFVKLNAYFSERQTADSLALNMITIESMRLWVFVLHLLSHQLSFGDALSFIKFSSQAILMSIKTSICSSESMVDQFTG